MTHVQSLSGRAKWVYFYLVQMRGRYSLMMLWLNRACLFPSHDIAPFWNLTHKSMWASDHFSEVNQHIKVRNRDSGVCRCVWSRSLWILQRQFQQMAFKKPGSPLSLDPGASRVWCIKYWAAGRKGSSSVPRKCLAACHTHKGNQ